MTRTKLDFQRSRDELLRLIDTLAGYIDGETAESFAVDERLRDSVANKLTQISHRLSRSAGHCSRRLERRFASYRNAAAHEYLDATPSDSWNLATQWLPQLREQVVANVEPSQNREQD